MFRNVKIVTSLAIVLGLFSLLQLTSAGLFFKSLNTDKDNLTELNSVREEQSKLDSSWTALLQARNDVTLAAHYYSRKDLEPEMAAYLKQSLIKTSDSLKEVKKSWSEYQSTQAAGSNKEILAAYTAYYNALS
ncbi:MAG: Tar ligand binding domain-containing protein, partial [Enterobacterales bacterium]|nr:Tar ligand binding domain-containing protein [Enterobacterales bacterium]